MSAPAPPTIAFELGVGEFRIVTTDAVYQIKVTRELLEAGRAAGPTPTPTTTPPPAPEAAGGAPAFFQEISEELFDKIGRLARKLSVSVEELPAQTTAPDLDQTDQELENAKGQLEEIVKITEKASMTIMDTADNIQTDMDQLKNQLEILQHLELMATPGEAARPPAEGETPTAVAIYDRLPSSTALDEKIQELKAFIDSRLTGLAPDQAPAALPPPPAEPAPAPAPSAPAPAQEPPAAAQTVTVTTFDVDVVFQTLYELCTNEPVKDHIKAMREAQAIGFKGAEIADKLSGMAPTVDAEDGFYNFPIPAVLKTLYAATTSDEYRTILKKMNQTAAGIFLDSVLPVEGQTMEVEIPAPAPAEPEETPEDAPEVAPDDTPEDTQELEAAVAAAVASGCSLADLRIIQTLAAEIEHQAALAPPPGQVVDAAENSQLYTSILTQDRDTIVQTVSMANDLIQKTGRHLNRILETLSFQDLSGQRIMKVVALISDIQRQLLSILVSVDTKIKVHQESAEPVVADKAEQMAQAEVDKALEKLSGGGDSVLLGPGAESRLDQGAVNDLLSQLGF